MRNKTKINTILFVLIIMFVPLLTSTTTQAWTTYTFDFSQDPYELNVRTGDIVVITIKRIPDSGDKLEKVLANVGGIETILSFSRNGEQLVEILPDQTLPTMLNPITFTIGPFDVDDIIVYEFRLVLDNAWDYKDTSSFKVFDEDEDLVRVPNGETSWYVYALIGGVTLVVLIGIGYVFKRRRAT